MATAMTIHLKEWHKILKLDNFRIATKNVLQPLLGRIPSFVDICGYNVQCRLHFLVYRKILRQPENIIALKIRWAPEYENLIASFSF